MSKKIITVSREFGSGDRTIAKEIAERLGYAYYDKELVPCLNCIDFIPDLSLLFLNTVRKPQNRYACAGFHWGLFLH